MILKLMQQLMKSKCSSVLQRARRRMQMKRAVMQSSFALNVTC